MLGRDGDPVPAASGLAAIVGAIGAVYVADGAWMVKIMKTITSDAKRFVSLDLEEARR